MAARKTIEWYERQLQTNTSLTSSQIEEYEEEIERLAEIEARTYNRMLERQQEEKRKFAEIKAKVEAGDANVIDLFGIPEFGNDYELCEESNGDHVVYSKVANENQDNRHVHKTEKEATSHYRKLIWDRLYNKYVRTGEYDSLRKME